MTMKKFIFQILTLLLIVAFYGFTHGSKPAKNIVAFLPQVLGATTDVSQPFKDAGAKVGFHIYYPASLPTGYSLSGVTVNTFDNGEIDYAIASADGSKRFIIAERLSTVPDWVSGNIMLSPSDLKAVQWNITNPTVNGQPATLGVSSNSSGPQGHEDLIYTTKDGVIVEIFDDFSYGQLPQVAQSMQ
jgi:hypothetical protein